MVSLQGWLPRTPGLWSPSAGGRAAHRAGQEARGESVRKGRTACPPQGTPR